MSAARMVASRRSDRAVVIAARPDAERARESAQRWRPRPSLARNGLRSTELAVARFYRVTRPSLPAAGRTPPHHQVVRGPGGPPASGLFAGKRQSDGLYGHRGLRKDAEEPRSMAREGVPSAPGGFVFFERFGLVGLGRLPVG